MKDCSQRLMDESSLSACAIAASDSVLVALSGGADSTALLLSLQALQKEGKVGGLFAAHLNHGIRGTFALRDQTFCETLCRELGIPLQTETCDAPAYAKQTGKTLEEAARELRYSFLERARIACGASVIATAHHADDQAETVLLHLARGAGRGGLGGMAPDTRLEGLRLIRPLLGVTRAEIEAYLRASGRAWREDATNRDRRHLRNRVRLGVLPMLARELNPRIREALARTAGILRAEDEHLDAAARRASRRCTRHDGLDAAALLRCPAPLRGRIVLEWLRASGVGEACLTHAAVDRVLAMAEDARGSRSAPLGGGRRVECAYGLLRVVQRTPSTPSGRTVNVPGAVMDVSSCLRLSVRRSRGFVRRAERGVGVWPAEARVHWARIAGRRLVWRPWRAGDRMRPLGAPGSAKIHDLLVNLKVPHTERRTVTVVECDGEVIWLPGHRIAEGWQVRSARSPSAALRIERLRTRGSPG